jgi:uncharacterized membrane protein
MVLAGEFAVAVGAGIKDESVGSFLMVIGLCAIIEGIVDMTKNAGLFK